MPLISPENVKHEQLSDVVQFISTHGLATTKPSQLCEATATVSDPIIRRVRTLVSFQAGDASPDFTKCRKAVSPTAPTHAEPHDAKYSPLGCNCATHGGKPAAATAAVHLSSLWEPATKYDAEMLKPDIGRDALRKLLPVKGDVMTFFQQHQTSTAPTLTVMAFVSNHVHDATPEASKGRPFWCIESSTRKHSTFGESCNQSFSTKSALVRHLRDVHPNPWDPFYRCRCGRRGNRKDNYVRHVDRVDDCQASFVLPYYKCKCEREHAGKDEHLEHVRGCTFSVRTQWISLSV